MVAHVTLGLLALAWRPTSRQDLALLLLRSPRLTQGPSSPCTQLQLMVRISLGPLAPAPAQGPAPSPGASPRRTPRSAPPCFHFEPNACRLKPANLPDL
ncbi:unnamed protein product [Prunus armeniaca]